MRIGIITLPLQTNYGGLLQAYALQTVLERMGHDVEVLATPNHQKVLTWKFPLRVIKRLIQRKRRPTKIFYESWFNKTFPIVSKYTQLFIERNIHRVEYRKYSILPNGKYDALIVGSDQIWRPMYFPQIADAYLSFAKKWDVKRIAYAASFGTDKWEYTQKQTLLCKKLIKRFDVVTVREQSGVHLCKEYLNVNATHVLDPTMLLDSGDYMKVVESSHVPESPGNMLCYILDETKENTALIERVARDKGLIPFRVNSKIENIWAPIEERIQPPVESWLRGFYDAEFVITDSFHACVFSILFRKPFIAIGNKERGLSRFESLLSMFGLQNRLVVSGSSYCNDGDIDWSSVYAILEEKRTFSESFLKDYLN